MLGNVKMMVHFLFVSFHYFKLRWKIQLWSITPECCHIELVTETIATYKPSTICNFAKLAF